MVLYLKGKDVACDDYIQFCKLGPCMAIQIEAWMAMQIKTWMTNYFSNDGYFFQDVRRSSGTSLTNRHLLVLDGHKFHVTLEANE
jgi:hypothetical protein